ncbi:MAG: transglutaminase-like cysteine peptidase [Rhodocyclaceae bacterium]|nr:transglutaminase-like cysteine peptidase [Rhodocyclaceae bacterium]MBX3666974.1 transglutaminase-like cysteine peptidase [Rhodocyclaceae bacterium]
MPFHRGASLLALICLPILAFSAQAYLGHAGTGLIREMRARFGAPSEKFLLAWRDRVRAPELGDKDELARVMSLNRLANGVPYSSDADHWGKEDYWATPAEFVASNGGDCEDYVFAKFFALREAGIGADKLRMIYVRAREANGGIINHMVLAYYPTENEEPYILDNRVPEVLPAHARRDLQPVYAFNDERVFSNDGRGGASSEIRRWRELSQRIERERSL